MKNNREAGFFLWETMLAGILLLVLAGSAGLYVRAAVLQDRAGCQAAAMYLARAQFSYAQGRLEQDGELPAKMMYQGPVDELVQNGCQYQVSSDCSPAGTGWQLQVEVVWHVQGKEERMVFMRRLEQRSERKPEGHDPL